MPFLYFSPSTWNDLPLPLWQRPSLDSFKSTLKTKQNPPNCISSLCCRFHVVCKLSCIYIYIVSMLRCLFVCVYALRIVSTDKSPWYNRNGWLGVKHQVTYSTDMILHFTTTLIIIIYLTTMEMKISSTLLSSPPFLHLSSCFLFHCNISLQATLVYETTVSLDTSCQAKAHLVIPIPT